MDTSAHSLPALFSQLGLPDSAAEIDRFILAHQGVPAGTALHESPCWTPSQAQFLREAISTDADWAEVVDSLALALQAPRPAG